MTAEISCRPMSNISVLHFDIHSFIHWHTPGSVAVLTTSSQWAMSDALRHAEYSPRINGLRSFCTVRSQQVAGRPGRRFHSGGDLWGAAATTLWSSSLGEARARWPKYCNRLYLTKSDRNYMSSVRNICLNLSKQCYKVFKYSRYLNTK